MFVSSFAVLVLCVSLAFGATYQNPVVNADAPDPGVLYYKGMWYMVTTGCNGDNCYPIRRSKDLAHWEHIGYVLSAKTRPSWAVRDFWAPELHIVNNHVNCYFSARHTDGRLTVGGATASSPEGPFKAFPNPLVQHSEGAIDVHVAYDAQTQRPHLVWKVDGNAFGKPTPIYIAELNDDGSRVTGTPTELIRNSLGWEGSLVEGPWIFYHAPYYYLFYSANGYASSRYAVGVARSKSLKGPYVKAAVPILSQIADRAPGHRFAGPGHCSVVHVPETGADVMVYHSWMSGSVGKSPGRVVLVDRIWWEKDGWPTVGTAGTPSKGVLPVPTSAEFAKMPQNVRLVGNGTLVNFETSQWSGNCWEESCIIGGSCSKKIIKVVEGLAGGGTVSLQSAKNKDMYFRHKNGVLYLEKNDGSNLFKWDASFRAVGGLKDQNKASLHASNYVNAFLRHKNGKIVLDDWDGSDLMASDGTWVVK